MAKAYQKYAWVLLLVPSLFLIVFATQGVIFGYGNMAPDNLVSAGVSASTPHATVVLLNYISRNSAWSTVSLMAFVVFVASTSYRRGNRWAWYGILWVFLTASVAGILEGIDEGQSLYAFFSSFSPIVALGYDTPVVLGLLLPYRIFFPNQRRSVVLLVAVLIALIFFIF
jgi:hypothetical protein